MSEKALVLGLILVVAVIGLFVLVKMDSSTGGSIVERNCLCAITMFDMYGNPYGTLNQVVRVQSAGAYADDACDNRCKYMFERGGDRTRVTGVAE